MPIDLLTTPLPSSTDTTNFDARADLAWSELATIIPQINTAVQAMNLNSLNTVSTTSHSAAIGSKTFTVGSGKSYVDGMWVTIADDTDPTKQMVAIVTSYSVTTLVVNVQWHSGFVGALADWIISQCPPFNTNAINDEVFLVTPNGCGSTNTLVRRYTTTVVNNGGSSMTWADSATNGGSLTINQTGIYAFSVKDIAGVAGCLVSIVKNVTTFSKTSADTLVYGLAVSGTDTDAMSVVVKCSASDVVRVVLSITSPATTGDCFFRAKRII